MKMYFHFNARCRVVGLCTRGCPQRSLARPGARVLVKGSVCGQEGEGTSAASAAAVGSTSVSAMPSRLLGYSIPPCTESDRAGLTRDLLASEECGRASGGTSGETSSQVLQL